MCDIVSGYSFPPLSGTSTSLPPFESTGRALSEFEPRLSTYAGTQPPSDFSSSQMQSEVSVCRSSAVCSSTGFSHDTSSVTMLW